MHEMGIILHMANMLDETAKEQNLTKIGSVTCWTRRRRSRTSRRSAL